MWAKVTGALREFGATTGALYLADRSLRMLSQSSGLYVYELMCQPIDGRALMPARLSRNITWRCIERGDPAVALMPARAEIKQARYDAGARCLGVERNGALVGYMWLKLDDYAEDEVRCTYGLPAGKAAAFDFDLYLFPEHRMGIGFVAVWHAASQYLWSQGVRCSYSRMTRFNLPSRRAHLRLGSRIVGRVLVLRIGALEVLLASVRPFFGASWGAQGRRPRLRLPSLPVAAAQQVASSQGAAGDVGSG